MKTITLNGKKMESHMDSCLFQRNQNFLIIQLSASEVHLLLTVIGHLCFGQIQFGQ